MCDVTWVPYPTHQVVIWSWKRGQTMIVDKFPLVLIDASSIIMRKPRNMSDNYQYECRIELNVVKRMSATLLAIDPCVMRHDQDRHIVIGPNRFLSRNLFRLVAFSQDWSRFAEWTKRICSSHAALAVLKSRASPGQMIASRHVPPALSLPS